MKNIFLIKSSNMIRSFSKLKAMLLTVAVAGISSFSIAQSATDFTADDCSGDSHSLFTDLDSGKVIVLVWVMPCISCLGPALTTNNVVESYQEDYPNRVFTYLCDDYANTSCGSVKNWATNNNMGSATVFSDASIDMLDYGSEGMPKIVVVGGTDHTVFYNSNFVVDPDALQDAIDAALASTTGVDELNSAASSFIVYPNPASGSADIKFILAADSPMELNLFNLKGEKVRSMFVGFLSHGQNSIHLSYDDIVSGMYLLEIKVGDQTKFINLTIIQ